MAAALTAVHEVDLVQTAGHFLDVAKGLSHVVEEGLCGVANFLILPVCKTIRKAGRLEY